MNYSEWRDGTIAAFREDLYGRGFTPEAVDKFCTMQLQLMDVAYNYGIKEANNDPREG